MGRRVELFAAIRFDWQRTGCGCGRWRASTRCTAGRCGRRSASPVPPDRKSPGAGRRRCGRRWRGGSTGCCGRTWTRRASSGIPPGGSSSGWLMSMTRRCRIRMCAEYVARRRAEIAARGPGGGRGLDGFVPQVREPGAEAEVDFGDVTVRLAGVLVKCYLFAFRLSYSGKACPPGVCEPARRRRSWKGTCPRSRSLGGVPCRQIRYDNLTPAVAKVLAGRSRTETARWPAFRSRYKSVPASSPGCLVPRVAAGSGLTCGSSGHRYRFEHSWCFFVIPEISSAISGVFPDS